MSGVYTLVVEVTKSENDDLPIGANGAAFVVFSAGDDVDEAVQDAVKLFREAGLSPMEVSNHGTIEERQDEGYEFSAEELELAEESLEKRAVIILSKQVFGLQ